MKKFNEIVKNVNSSYAGDGKIEVYGVYKNEEDSVTIQMNIKSFFDVHIVVNDNGEKDKWFYTCKNEFNDIDEFIKTSVELFDDCVAQYFDGYEIIKAESNLFELDPRIEPALEELKNKEVILIK